MIERVCSSCNHGNPLDDKFCGKCGKPLERHLPIAGQDAPLTIAGRSLPVTWKQLSRTVAVSVAALAAEAGIAWLRRKMEPSSSAIQPITSTKKVRPMSRSDEKPRSVTTVESQRTVEVQRAKDGSPKVVEKSFWRRIEE